MPSERWSYRRRRDVGTKSEVCNAGPVTYIVYKTAARDGVHQTGAKRLETVVGAQGKEAVKIGAEAARHTKAKQCHTPQKEADSADDIE